MKRKRRLDKMSYSELKEAGHAELADHVLRRRNTTIAFIREHGTPPPRFARLPESHRFIAP